MAMSKSVLAASAATVHQPRGSDDNSEQAKAGRTTLRMALLRHECPELPACPIHGKNPCDCHPCDSPVHADDMALLDEALRAFGLIYQPRNTHRVCEVCGIPKPQRQFNATTHDRCNKCVVEAAHARREAEDGNA